MKIRKLGWMVLAVALALGSLSAKAEAVDNGVDPVCYDECRLDGWSRAYCLKLCSY